MATDTTSVPTIVGLFADQEAAERAVNQLGAAGFTAEQIGLVAPGDTAEPNYAKDVGAGLVAGGGLGATD